MNETPSRILVVDDEPSITEFVGYALKKEGFRPDVVDNGEDALAMAQENDYDLFVLDIMLPGMDGYELCRRLRTKTSAPVLFLSARDTELDKVVGLEIGGDDYLAKPFGVRELIARVRALLRRGPGRIDWRRTATPSPPAASRSTRTRTPPPAPPATSTPQPPRVRADGMPYEERRQGGFARGAAARRLGLGIPHGNQDRGHPRREPPA